MPLRRNRNINDAYEQEFKQRVMTRMEERLDQFVDQLADQMNDIMNPRRHGDRNGRRSECEESENPFFEDDGSSFDEQPDRPRTLFVEPIIWDIGDEEEERRINAVYDTDIEDVIEEEEGFVEIGVFGREEDNIEDVVVVANDHCSSMIQTTLSVYFEEDINTKSHELMSFGKKYYYQGDTNLNAASTRDEWGKLEDEFFSSGGG
ncbi:hypothetical protein Tco_1328590 [Tanacetum coccineum]